MGVSRSPTRIAPAPTRADDVGAQAAAVHERAQDAAAVEAVEVGAWLAEAAAAAARVAERFIAFFVIVFFVAPFVAEDDRPGFKRLDRKPRQAVGAWFRDIHQR
jgi:hypothetical protein